MNEKIKKQIINYSDSCTFGQVIRFLIENDISEIKKIETETSINIQYSTSTKFFDRTYKVNDMTIRVYEKTGNL